LCTSYHFNTRAYELQILKKIIAITEFHLLSKEEKRMPFVNVKLIKSQVNSNSKKQILSKLTDLIVSIMNRERALTTIVIDEIDPTSWAIGGKAINAEADFVSFINIKVSKGTTNEKEMASMMNETKKMMSDVLGNHISENYFIIDELNPAAWGFDGISMTERSILENQ